MTKDTPCVDVSTVIGVGPERVLRAFFDRTDLRIWWEATWAITTPRVLGAYAIEWETTDYQDDVLGPLGGTFHGTVVDFTPQREFCVAQAYWVPPKGNPIGPMVLDVVCTPARGEAGRSDLHITQRGFEPGARWTRYYELVGEGWPSSLDRLKGYLEREAEQS